MSARLDGETELKPSDGVDAHLAECGACRAWQAEIGALTRGLRVRAVEATPDLVDGVVARVPGRDRRRTVLRVALAVVALAQLALGVAQSLGFAHHAHGTTMSAHLFNESTAWNIAIGIGLAWAVFRDRAVAGLLPMLCGFMLVLVGFSTHDLVTGVVDVQRLATHGLVVVGIALLTAVHRLDHDEPGPGPGEVSGPSSPWKRRGQPSAPGPASDGGPGLRPSAHRRAA